MPIIESDFRSPWWMPGGDVQTQLPVLMRRFQLSSDLVTIPTRDNDRLSANLYTSKDNHRHRLLILTHGLEGSNHQPYILGMIDAVIKQGLAGESTDILAWNLRGCGEPDNKTFKLYYAGSTDDMDDVIQWAEINGYKEIFLAGYSLGGNVVLKWLADQGVNAIQRGIKVCCTASVPVDLAGCVKALDRWRNILYRWYFVFSMKNRLMRKVMTYSNSIDLSHHVRVNSFHSYDEIYCAPLNGFSSAEDMHAHVSAKFVLDKVAVPTLLVAAQNDPFLNKDCYPVDIARTHSLLTLELTKTGGHVGFYSNQGKWWLEQRFLQFFSSMA